MEKILIAEERYGRKSNHFAADDFIDRLNNRITVMALAMCIFIITGTTYVGKAINCWTPAEFKGQHDGYANSICWLKGSYYLPTEEITIPDRSQPRTYYVSYYQWTPFILLGMSLFFLLPKLIWHTFIRQGGLNIKRLVQTIKDKPNAEKGVEFVKRALQQYLDAQNTLHGTICCGCRCNNVYFSYTLMYFITKILYVINTLSQFFLLNAFLSFNFSTYGPEALRKLFGSEDWFESPRFPRVTMCDFMVRRLGSNQHWYAIQCNLPINMYNEKIFLGIWLWLIILTILNVLSIFVWIVSLARPRRLAAIKKYLRVVRDVPSRKQKRLAASEALRFQRPESNELFGEFLDYLHADGYLIYRIIAHNTDELVAGQILEHLYTHFMQLLRSKNNSEV